MYIQISFPSGRCYSAQSSDPTLPEWPPHPSRLFSAFVASAYCSNPGMTESRRSALEWLEALPPPAISAPEADLATAPVCYVPPGDAVQSKGKKNNKSWEHPVHRWRQPRYFPCAIILGDPVVLYGWEQDPDPELLEELKSVVKGITHVGTSHSMAVVSIHLGGLPCKPNLVPDQRGESFLRVPVSGRLAELDSVHERKEGLRRPTPVCENRVAYRDREHGLFPDHESDFDLIILRISGTMHGADTAAYLAKSLRRAVMSVLGDNAPPAIHGHGEDKHVGWLPLPDVGRQYATGRIVGIGVALPRQLPQKDRLQILSGLNQVRNLRLPDGRIANLSPLSPGEKAPVALKRLVWMRPSAIWSTVTPVVIDRPPKRLTEDRLRKALLQSFKFAGYSEPSEIELSGYSRFTGAPPAFRVPVSKPRYHVTVRFKEPVMGPVIAGRLRYYGVGLFRPIGDLENRGAP